MPDLDQLFDAIVTDVSARTRPPGAQPAIRRARRRRSTVAVVAAVALIAAGSGLATEALRGDDAVSPTDKPSATSEPSPPQDSPPVPSASDEFTTELRGILAEAPDWTVAADDPTILHPCNGDGSWAAGSTGGRGRSVSLGDADGPSVWTDEVGFRSAASAAAAVDRLAKTLSSCTTISWRTNHIGKTGAVLAFTADGVIWIHHRRTSVGTLQVPTNHGPPPRRVQVEVADLLRTSIG